MTHILKYDEYLLEKAPAFSERAFSVWKDKWDEYMSYTIRDCQKDYLDEWGLKVELDPDYAFTGGKAKWVAAYERQSRRIKTGVIPIAINYRQMYSKMRGARLDKNEYNIEAHARITIGHEIGHALCDYIRLLPSDEIRYIRENLPKDYARDFERIVSGSNRKYEEELVEEFGESMFTDATGVIGGRLDTILGWVKKLERKINGKQ